MSELIIIYITILFKMSAEFIRRKLVLRLQSTPDKVYIDKLASKISALEKQVNAEVEFVNHPVNGSIAVKFNNGESYEFFNYQDPMRDKPKKPGYKPPEIESKKLTQEIKEDVQTGSFGTLKFCIYAILAVLAMFDVVICWVIFKQLQ